MSVAENPRELETRRQTVNELKRLDVECRMLDAKEFREMEPNITPEISGGAIFPEDGQVNPLLATFPIAQGAKNYGAQIQTETAVTGIELSKDKSKVTAVQTTAGKISTKNVVNAAGAWSGLIGQMVGLNIPVVPRRGNLMVVEHRPKSIINHKIILAS